MREDDFECELDAALARYAAVEPRDGLEQRVLANLRGERQVRWGWVRPVAALATAVVVGAILLGWRATHSRASVAAVHSAAQGAAGLHEIQVSRGESRSVKARGEEVATRDMRKGGMRRHKTESTVLPKLDQFPTPEPLSDGERLLVRFVDEDPQEAALMAEAQTIELQREKNVMNGTDTDSSFRPQEQ